MSAEVAPEVRDVPERSRYELVVDGEVVGFAAYALDGRVITLPHVEVDPARQGHSLGSVLVRAALDDARARSLRVRAVCPFVQVYVRGHAEYQDLLAPGG